MLKVKLNKLQEYVKPGEVWKNNNNESYEILTVGVDKRFDVKNVRTNIIHKVYDIGVYERITSKEDCEDVYEKVIEWACSCN